MKYNRLGSAGIKLSALSLGSWVTYGQQVDIDAAAASMKAAYDGGVNFFDNAESYAAGKSEEIMGKALKKLGFRRGSYLVSTKIYWGLHENGVLGPSTSTVACLAWVRKYAIRRVNNYRNTISLSII